MPSLSPNDRVSLCLFSFTDGRRCRTPRSGHHPHFCFYHAQKEAQAQTADSLAKDLASFFSGDYLSACDLSTAMARLIPAVIRGDIKPRLARTVAYMMQGLIQTVHLAKDEYMNAFGVDGWRKAIRTSVNANYDHRFPSAPKLESQRPAPPAPAPAQSPAPPTPAATVGAGLARPDSLARPLTHSTANAHASRHNSAPPQSAAPAANPAAPEACHPERSEGPCHNPVPSTTSETRLASAPDQTTHPVKPVPPAPPPPQRPLRAPNREPYAIHFDHNYRLRIDGKPF